MRLDAETVFCKPPFSLPQTQFATQEIRTSIQKSKCAESKRAWEFSNFLRRRRNYVACGCTSRDR
jgi:hypothetical protein